MLSGGSREPLGPIKTTPGSIRQDKNGDSLYHHWVPPLTLTQQINYRSSPFVERLLKKGFEVLYLTEPVDEYCIQAMPEFEGKKFQNVAKEGLKLDDGEKSKEAFQQLEEQVRGLKTHV
jgi:HSP90 family molecular chaperone